MLCWVTMASKVMSQLEVALQLPAEQQGKVDVGPEYPLRTAAAAAATSNSADADADAGAGTDTGTDADAGAGTDTGTDADTAGTSNTYSYAELSMYLQSRLTALHWHPAAFTDTAATTAGAGTSAAAASAEMPHGGRFADVGIAGSGASGDRILPALAVLCGKTKDTHPSQAQGGGGGAKEMTKAFVPIEEIQRQQSLHEHKIAAAKAVAEARALAQAQHGDATEDGDIDPKTEDTEEDKTEKGKDTFRMDFSGVCPDSHPYFMQPLSDGRGGYDISEKYMLAGEAVLKPLQHTGYVNLFPFLLRLISTDEDLSAESTIFQQQQQQQQQQLDYSLRLIEDPELLWTPHGLRSIARSDVFYRKGELLRCVHVYACWDVREACARVLDFSWP